MSRQERGEETEWIAVRNLVNVWRCVSPAFVHRLVREHGAASLLELFHLRDLPPDRALTFLLRCHKGRFYRNRYPLDRARRRKLN
jgi:hypothetical protein